jgi:serine protease
MDTKFRGLLASFTISLLAAACGGGGGGGGNSQDVAPVTPPEPQPPPQSFSVSGTITASSNQAVDSDTNDATRLAVSNDTLALAQIIDNPTTLGGYINEPGTGAQGRSQESGDIDDYFEVELLAGHRVTLLVGDFEEADADLFLYDTAGNILDFSIDTGEIESLLIAEDGTYLINAFAFSGATNYILAIGAANLSEQNVATRYSIVPWQAVVTYKEETPQSSAASKSQKMSRSFGLEQRAGGPGRGRLMAMRRGLVNAQHADQKLARAAIRKSDSISDPDLRARWETLMTIKSLRADPEVRYAEPNYQVKTTAIPNDTAFPLQWHFPLIGLPDAWEITTGSFSVVVAVVDTGVLSNHPDLIGQLVDGYDFVRDPASAGDGDGIDSNPQDPGNNFGGGSDSFHGTHVSGTVAARGDNGVGVAGTAYSAKVMPVRALGVGGAGTSFDVDQAIRFAAGLPNDSGTTPPQRADIINLSLGGAPFSQITQDLFNQVRAAGVMVVAAAGNEASSTLGYPASYDGVISVSAVDVQRRLATYSNTGAAIDVAAPGGDNSVDINGDGYPDGVLSTGGTKSGGAINYVYSFLNGTSMASPHVAGVMALMKSVNPDLTPADFDAMLRDGQLSDDLGPAGRDDQFGYGIINAQRAVLAALEANGTTPADNPRLSASASGLNFGSASTMLELVLRNGGKGDLALLSLTASQPWLQIEAASVDVSGLGTYQIKVDRSGLSDGIYTADINAQSDINNLAIRILMSVGSLSAGSDVGVIYVLLYDPVRNEPVAQFASGGSGSGYPFQFSDIAAGEYELIAGSDADNDSLICDAGEACGAWLTIDQPIRITLDSDMADLNFPMEFLVSLPNISSQSQPQSSIGKQREASDEGLGTIKRLPDGN